MTPDVSSTTTTPTPTASAATGTSLQDLASDFETFLKMLTAQAKYQDPLEPLDSSEYASQLAQFSMVEQQVQTNDSLSELMSMQQTSTLSAWVGKEVRAQGSGWFDGQMVTVLPKVNTTADKAVLVVKDQAGSVVQRLDIPVSNDPIQWAGIDEDGSVLPTGYYSFEVESHRQFEVTGTEPSETYSRVVEAQVDGTAISLVLEGGKVLPTAEVNALREPV